MEQYFAIIGAQRCGTTYLYSVLDAHPEITLAKPLKPEPKFFLNQREYSKGKSFYLETYFPDFITEKKVIGEKSTSYIEFNLSERILSIFPNAKILVMLRNPVDRAISNYYFTFNNGLETRSLTEVFLEQKPRPTLENKKLSVSPYDYIERGFYSGYLNPYLEAFGKHMKILIFEDFIGNKKKIDKVFDFLGVRPKKSLQNIYKAYNKGNYVESIELKKVRSFLQELYKKEIKKIEDIVSYKLSNW